MFQITVYKQYNKINKNLGDLFDCQIVFYSAKGG